jgi:demethylmenaquinone methyltransferase/2-methoxy-6-polyprenyl-1,4-benzoquinol methylase
VNPFFEPGTQRAAKVQELFAKVAPRYDLLNDLMSFGLHRRWKRRLVRMAGPKPAQRELDICCGTGDIALAFGKLGVETVGLDFSQPMLEIAAKRCRREQQAAARASAPDEPYLFKPPHYQQGDAQQIPFPDQSFDIVTVGYGLRNLADWRVGLKEMARVAKPGGRLLVLDFGKPDNPLWRSIYFGYLRLFVPLLGLVISGSASAYSYILESLKHYPAQHGVAAAMEELGLKDIRIVNFLGGVMTINHGRKTAIVPNPIIRSPPH